VAGKTVHQLGATYCCIITRSITKNSWWHYSSSAHGNKSREAITCE